jgi:outer membrane protein TolC
MRLVFHRILRVCHTCTLLTLGITTWATAQTITLRRAVELTLSHSGMTGMADPEQARAYAAYREARSAYLPRLVLGSGIGGSYGFPLSLENAAPSLVNVTSQQVLFSAAQKSFVRSANSGYQSAKWQGQDQRDALIQDAVLTYVELNKWNQELDLLKTELGNNQKMEAVEQERIQAGVDKPVELNKVKLATARVRLRAAEAQGSADVMRLHLAQLTGLPAEELGTDPNSIPSLPEFKQDEDLARRAIGVNPAVKAAEQQATARLLNAEGEYRSLFPSVDFAAQYALLANFNNYDVYIKNFQHHNVTGGLVFRLPFFDPVQRARAAEAKAEAVRSAKQAEEAKQKVSLETLRLQRVVEQLATSVEVAQLEYDLAQSDFDAAQVRVQTEIGTLREEQDARSKVEQSYDALIDANLALDKARVQLLRNTGDLEQWALSGR